MNKSIITALDEVVGSVVNRVDLSRVVASGSSAFALCNNMDVSN